MEAAEIHLPAELWTLKVKLVIFRTFYLLRAAVFFPFEAKARPKVQRSAISGGLFSEQISSVCTGLCGLGLKQHVCFREERQLTSGRSSFSSD